MRPLVLLRTNTPTNQRESNLMRKNTMKQAMLESKVTYGPFVGYPSPAMTELMGWAGFDFVVIDCEHGVIDYESAENMIRAAELSGTTPILRIGMNEQQHIQRYLEAGAQGVMIPLINNAQQGKQVVDSVKYPPVGKRGGFSGRSAMFGVQEQAEYVKQANEETFVCLQIETPESIDNADEIINTEGADCIFFGPGDLSLNFGYPGQIDHPEVVSVIERLVKQTHEAGKISGTLGVTPELAKFWSDRGVQWIVSGATRFLLAGARGYLGAVRG